VFTTCFKGIIMTDPISANNPRISTANTAARSLEKLDKKSAADKTSDAPVAKAPVQAQGGDSVNLSNVQQRINDQPDFDRAKIEAIKAAIQGGNYPINPGRIAQNFVSIEKMIQG
jgi:negative regulator of flagellin synthesis FlgM